MKTYTNAVGTPISRQRAEQLRHPERQRARAAVFNRVVNGSMPRPTTLACADCGKTAREYDHYLGYEPEHWLDVQAVCRRCHYDREKLRHGTCHRGHPYTLETTRVTKLGHRSCTECARENRERKGTTNHAHVPRDPSGSRRVTAIYLYDDDDERVDALLGSGYASTRSELFRRALRDAFDHGRIEVAS